MEVAQEWLKRQGWESTESHRGEWTRLALARGLLAFWSCAGCDRLDRKSLLRQWLVDM